MPSLILASASPRRRRLLSEIGLRFKVSPSRLHEDVRGLRDPVAICRKLAVDKAKSVVRHHPEDYVLAADTIVVFQGRILGKPKNRKEAVDMLTMLSGRRHEVLTCVVLAAPGQRMTSVLARTKVLMRRYSDQEIRRFVASGRALDKAGAYAIQDPKFCPVASIKGCYCNVVGLPVKTVLILLKKRNFFSPGRLPRLFACRECPLAR
ncbi:MAG: septum formation protein Maf [Elusimicrobia bacterium]|nr:septum formation protein Maf [Elusimicrobiota bacterium]